MFSVSPGFHIGLRPHSTLGFAGVSPFQGSLSDCLCFPRVSYRALPSFHPGLCRSVALSGLVVVLAVYPQGFISGFALIPPWAMQECRPFRAFCRIVCCIPRVSYRALPSFHPGLCRSAALSGLFVGLSVYPQGFISGFALIPPWARQEYRPCRALCRIGRVSPGFHIGLCPHFTLGFAGVSPFQGFLSYWLCFPRVSYRALPSFHPGLCRSIALAGLFVVLVVFPQGFISGFALIPPWAMQECRPFRAL